MTKQQMNCPQCQQPVIVDVEQVFDMATDPTAKEKLLSGTVNVVMCPYCRYNGGLATPLIYHDPEKELFLTYIPAEMNLTPDRREALVGKLINQVVDNLPPEKRKGYLFNPGSALTFQGLIERILEEDGITKEMIQAQQDRITLLGRMLDASEDVLLEIIKQEEALIDEEFFGLLGTIVQQTSQGNDREGLEKLSQLQNALIENSTFGQELKKQNEVLEATVAKIQAHGEDLDADKLIQEGLDALDNDVALNVIASMARPLMNYEFFVKLSEKIDAAEADEKKNLETLRDKLVELTEAIDKQMQERIEATQKNIDLLANAENVEQATLQNMQGIDEFFLQVLEMELGIANQTENKERYEKLMQIYSAVQKASVPPGAELVSALLDMPVEDQDAYLKEHEEEINDDVISFITQLNIQSKDLPDEQMDAALKTKVEALYGKIVTFSMKKNMGK